MAKSACKCKATECEECPEWIFTFADLVMLMMGFFVILWVLKPNPTNGKATAEADDKWLEIVAKIREAFDYLPDPTSKDPVDVHIIMKKLEEMDPLKGKGEGGKTRVKPHGAEGTDPEVTSIRPGKHAIIGTRIDFDAGKTDLNPRAQAALKDMVQLVQGHRQIFLVKGHTSQDDFTEQATAEQKMMISVRRAQSVVDYLSNHGVEPQILRVQGCSTFEPVVAGAYTNDVRAQNRRVEVEASDNSVTERQDQVKTSKVLPPGINTDTATAPLETIDHK